MFSFVSFAYESLPGNANQKETDIAAREKERQKEVGTACFTFDHFIFVLNIQFGSVCAHFNSTTTTKHTHQTITQMPFNEDEKLTSFLDINHLYIFMQTDTKNTFLNVTH